MFRSRFVARMRNFWLVMISISFPLFPFFWCFLWHPGKDNFRRVRLEWRCNAVDTPTHICQKPQLAEIDGAGGVGRNLENVVLIVMQRKRQLIESGTKTFGG